MTVFAHMNKLKDFMEHWNTLHTSLEKGVSECLDWVQETRNALNIALEKAQNIRQQTKRDLDRAYEMPEGSERQRKIQQYEQAHEQACKQYEKVDDQLSTFVRDSAQYTQAQQEILADIKVLQKKGAAWLENYIAKLKEAKMAILGDFCGSSQGASGAASSLSEDDAALKESPAKEKRGDKVYYDDNGKKYRVGDQLESNAKFEVNGYQYETDEQGRPISAEGTLRIRDPKFKRNMDPMSAVGKGDQQEGDHRGHLIGYQFEGSGGIENLVPMAGKLNQGDYETLEKTLADAVKDGADVKLKVEPRYDGDSNRPSEFRVTYSIDGEKDVVVFKNGSDS